MVMRLSILVLATVACIGVRAQNSGDTIWKEVLAHPPSVPQTNARSDVLKRLDAWLAEPNSECSDAVVAYYRRAVDRVLDLIEKERVTKGVRVFQLYSSSIIVQTPEVMFGIDLDQGPNRQLDRAPADENVALCMTGDQIERLARLVDISFHTHEHYDHIDYQIVQAFLNAGKQVIVTQSNKNLWKGKSWADKLIVLDQTVETPRNVGPLKVDVLHDFQWADAAHLSGTPCNAYLITTPDGTTVGTKGDINCGLCLYGWLHLMAEHGRHMDIMVGSLGFWRGVNLLAEIDALFGPVWATGHIWEFTHRPAGTCGGACGTYAANYLAARRGVHKDTAVVLSWGEYLDIQPKTQKSKE